MESDEEQRTQSYSYESHEDKALGSKMAELAKIKEELRIAKERAMQAWIDTRPLKDELERMKSGLASAETESNKPDIISELESQLEATNIAIRTKREEGQKANKIINETNRALDQRRQEMERSKLETDGARGAREARAGLKQALLLRRQTLQTLQLGIRAIQIEKEALDESRTEALQYTNCSEMDITTVHLKLEDYNALTKRAEDENTLIDWRVSISTEQKIATEASRNKALAKLTRLYSQERSRGREIMEENISEDEHYRYPEMTPPPPSSEQSNKHAISEKTTKAEIKQ